ncbi:MAG: hypothetical protein IPL75_10925 [Acidobacteria bacterium]|nr:hypothetical protein [Acidobacteriota bacterium]
MNARAVCQFVVGFVLVALAGLYVNWSSHYFFLFDDFALFGEASRRTAAEIVTTPLFGFYRPLVFLLTKVEFGVFGWQHPEAALAISQSIHLINAGLAFLLARKLRLSMTASAVAAATFALSPWSSESYGWVSARFDVVSTSGVLSTLLLMMAASDAPGRGTRAVATVAGVVTTLVAVFAKESGALLPVYCAAVLLAKGPRLRMPWLFLLGVTTGVGVYLVCRHSVLPSLGGAYGSFPTLVADADIVANLGRYLLAFVAVPRPGFTPTASAGLVLVAVLVGLGLIIGWQVFRERRALLWLCLGAFLVGLAPVIWLPVLAGSTAAGRFLYLPGLWICILAGAASERGLRRDGASLLASLGVALLVPLLAAMALVSVTHQATTWKMAASLSRRGIQAFAPLVDQGLTTVYLPALPYWFAEGPFVLKSYAFGFYYAGRDVPAVRTHDMVVTRLGNRAIFGGWKDAAPQTALGPKVTIHDLGLPVSGMPTRLSLDPTRVSLLQTANSRPGGGSLIALDGPATVRWSIDIPAGAPIAITPAQGDGPATLAVTITSAPPGLDETIIARLRVDGRSVLLPDIAVHIRTLADLDTVPPFGSLDAPSADFALSQPTLLQGWTLDDFDLRRVWVARVAPDGSQVPLGNVVVQGERPDITRQYSRAYNTTQAAWSFVLEPAAVAGAVRPFVVQVLAEDGAGHQIVIGQRTVR